MDKKIPTEEVSDSALKSSQENITFNKQVVPKQNSFKFKKSSMTKSKTILEKKLELPKPKTIARNRSFKSNILGKATKAMKVATAPPGI